MNKLALVSLMLSMAARPVKSQLTLCENLNHCESGYKVKFAKKKIRVFANPSVFKTKRQKLDLVEQFKKVNAELPTLEFVFKGFHKPRGLRYIYITGEGRFQNVGALGYADFSRYSFIGKEMVVDRCKARVLFADANRLTAISLHEMLHCVGVPHEEVSDSLMNSVISSLRVSENTKAIIRNIYE